MFGHLAVKSQSHLNNCHLYSKGFFTPCSLTVLVRGRCSGQRRIILISVFGWMLTLTSCHWRGDDIMDAVLSSEPCCLDFLDRAVYSLCLLAAYSGGKPLSLFTRVLCLSTTLSYLYFIVFFICHVILLLCYRFFFDNFGGMLLGSRFQTWNKSFLKCHEWKNCWKKYAEEKHFLLISGLFVFLTWFHTWTRVFFFFFFFFF